MGIRLSYYDIDGHWDNLMLEIPDWGFDPFVCAPLSDLLDWR